MPRGRTFKEVAKDIGGQMADTMVNQTLPLAGKALSLPGRAFTAGIGLAAPSIAAPYAYSQFRKQGFDRKTSLRETGQFVTDEQKKNVSDAMAGDATRRAQTIVNRSDRLSPMQKRAGVVALKGMEFGAQVGGTRAASLTISAGAQKAQKALEGYQNLKIANNPVPEAIIMNEKKHAIDQIVGHPQSADLYHPEKQKAAEAIGAAVEKAKNAPLKDFGKTVQANIPKQYMKDPAVVDSLNNWLGQTKMITEMVKSFPQSQQTYHSFEFLSGLVRSKQFAAVDLAPLGNLIKNLTQKND